MIKFLFAERNGQLVRGIPLTSTNVKSTLPKLSELLHTFEMNKFTMMKSIIFLIAISNMIVSFVDGGGCWGSDRMPDDTIVDYNEPTRSSVGRFRDEDIPVFMMEVMITNILFMHARDHNKLEEIIEEMAFNKNLQFAKMNFMVAVPEKSSILKTLPDDLLEFEDNDTENAKYYQKEMARIIRQKLNIPETTDEEFINNYSDRYNDDVKAVERQESTISVNPNFQLMDDEEDVNQPEIVEDHSRDDAPNFEYGGPSFTSFQHGDASQNFEHGQPSYVSTDDASDYYGPEKIVEDHSRDDAPTLDMAPLAEYRRSLTAPAVKNILLRKLAVGGRNWRRNYKAVDAVCRLLGVYYNALFPKRFIVYYRVIYSEHTCTISHTVNKFLTFKFTKTEWFKQKKNGKSESLVELLFSS